MIHARVQHHPSRAHLLPALLERLEPLPTQVVSHFSEPPSPWDGYLKCLTNIPSCSHLLIVQDDAMPVPSFVPALAKIAARNPDAPVCLFLARLPREASRKAAQAMKGNVRYIDLSWRSFLPMVAMLWPRHKAVEFKEWADANPTLPGQRQPRSDDAMGGRWKMVTRQTVRCTVPSIVEHLCVPSVKGSDNAASGWTAALLAADAMAYEW